MATLNEAAEREERERVLKELRAQRALKAGEVEKLDQQIEQLTDADFRKRLGDMRRGQMSTAEKSEQFRELVRSDT